MELVDFNPLQTKPLQAASHRGLQMFWAGVVRPSSRTHSFPPALGGDDQARRITTVFRTPQPLDDDGYHFLRTNVPDSSAVARILCEPDVEKWAC
jgi:hypothetical protein